MGMGNSTYRWLFRRPSQLRWGASNSLIPQADVDRLAFCKYYKCLLAYWAHCWAWLSIAEHCWALLSIKELSVCSPWARRELAVSLPWACRELAVSLPWARRELAMSSPWARCELNRCSLGVSWRPWSFMWDLWGLFFSFLGALGLEHSQ
jgi:hypothetical protein